MTNYFQFRTYKFKHCKKLLDSIVMDTILLEKKKYVDINTRDWGYEDGSNMHGKKKA